MSGSPCGGCLMRSTPTQTTIYSPGMVPTESPAPMAVCQNAASDNYARRCRNIRSCEDRQSSIYPSERARVVPARLP
jgi:hypothetical protein